MITSDRSIVKYNEKKRFVIETCYKTAILIRYIFTKYSNVEKVNLERLMWFYFAFLRVQTHIYPMYI